MMRWWQNNIYQNWVSRVRIIDFKSIFINFYPNKEITYVTEVNSKLAFLDVLLPKGQNIKNIAYRKVPNSDIYLSWNSFWSQSWKQGTLKPLIQRRHLICLTEDLLKTEINHIQKVFLEMNDFPLWVIKQIFAEKYQKNKQQNMEDNDRSVINTEKEISVTCWCYLIKANKDHV